MGNPNEIVVGIADIKVAESPKILKTNLGSCIAVCLYSQNKKVGGMLHLMLASSSELHDKNNLKKAKYADTGIPELLDQLGKLYGVKPEELTAKIFGGAKVLKNVTRRIGDENADAVKSILKSYGIRITASELGGEKGYRITFFLETGKVISQVFGQEEKEY